MFHNIFFILILAIVGMQLAYGLPECDTNLASRMESGEEDNHYVTPMNSGFFIGATQQILTYNLAIFKMVDFLPSTYLKGIQ